MTENSSKPVLKKRQSRNFLNTYRLSPNKPFDVLKTKTQMKNIMELNLQEVEYAEDIMKDMIITLVDEIYNTVKIEEYNRYRIIVTIAIGQKRMQGVHMNHSFLWDRDKDKYADYIYENNSFFVQGLVYAIYLD